MRVLVTRPIPQATKTASRLSELGHECIVAPLLEIHYFENVSISAEGLSGVVATSGRSIEALARHSILSHIRRMPLYCVGEQTAANAREIGFCNILKIGKDVEDLIRQIDVVLTSNSGKLLYVAGQQRKDNFEMKMLESGTKFEVAVLYETKQIKKFPANIVFQIESGRIDAVLVFSKRSGEALVAALQKTGLKERLFQIAYLSISHDAAEPLYALGNINVHLAKESNESALLNLLDQIV